MGFLGGAYKSRLEEKGKKRRIYAMMDPLIGRYSFYTWAEMKPFLHKIFVIKTGAQPVVLPALPGA
jgi:hypothetical protein